MGRGDDPHVGLNRLVPADSFESLLLQQPQQLALHERRHVPHFVQKDGSSGALFELADSLPIGSRGHSHYDHIAGGQPFKDIGAKFIAHKNAVARLKQLKPADVVIPDEGVGNLRKITLGGTVLELHYVGKNHGDNTLVMLLPKEKIIFTVDWIPLQAVQFRGMADTYLPETQEGLRKVIAMDWNTLISGHPGPGGRQTGTKDDARNVLSYLDDVSAAVKKEVDAGKSYDEAMRGIKLPKYETWGGYGPFLPMNIERFFDFHNRGI